MTTDDHAAHFPWEGISSPWGRPEPRRQHADPVVEELQKGTVLIAVDVAPEFIQVDGVLTRAARNAYGDDALYAILEKAAFLGLNHHSRPREYWNRLLVIAGTQNTSAAVAKLVIEAQRKKLGIYFFDPNSRKIVKHK